jgi:chromosome segregation protein
LLETDGRVIAGPLGDRGGIPGVTGVISRKSELRRLRGRLAQLDETIAADQQALAALSDRASHIEAVSQELRQGIYEANSVRVELASRLEGLGGQIARLEREQPVLSAETEQVHRQLRDANQKRATTEEAAKQVEEDSAARQQRVAELDAAVAELRRQSEASREGVTALRVELGKLVEQLSSAQRQVRQLEIARADMDRQHKLLEEQLAGYRGRIDGLQETAFEAGKTIEQVDVRLKELITRAELVEHRLTKANESLTAIQTKLAEHRAATEAADQVLHQLQVARAELDVKLDGVRQRAQEQLSLDVVEAYQKALEEAPRHEGTEGRGGRLNAGGRSLALRVLLGTVLLAGQL